jgi:hypothetical protein
VLCEEVNAAVASDTVLGQVSADQTLSAGVSGALQELDARSTVAVATREPPMELMQVCRASSFWRSPTYSVTATTAECFPCVVDYYWWHAIGGPCAGARKARHQGANTEYPKSQGLILQRSVCHAAACLFWQRAKAGGKCSWGFMVACLYVQLQPDN